MLSSDSTRFNGQLDRTAQGWNLYRCPQYSLPRRQRQIKVEVTAADPIQPMRLQSQHNIQIAGTPAVTALGTLACQSKSLSIGCAHGNCHPECSRHIML